MMTGGTGLPERALAPEGSRRPRQQNPRLGMARHRIPDRTAGRDGRKLLVCVIEAVEILKVKRLYRTYC